jgi:hypothetical protein
MLRPDHGCFHHVAQIFNELRHFVSYLATSVEVISPL